MRRKGTSSGTRRCAPCPKQMHESICTTTPLPCTSSSLFRCRSPMPSRQLAVDDIARVAVPHCPAVARAVRRRPELACKRMCRRLGREALEDGQQHGGGPLLSWHLRWHPRRLQRRLQLCVQRFARLERHHRRPRRRRRRGARHGGARRRRGKAAAVRDCCAGLRGGGDRQAVRLGDVACGLTVYGGALRRRRRRHGGGGRRRCCGRACHASKTSKMVYDRGAHCTTPMPGQSGTTLSVMVCRSNDAGGAARRRARSAAAPVWLCTHASRHASSCQIRCSCCRPSPALSRKRADWNLKSIRSGRVLDGGTRAMGLTPARCPWTHKHVLAWCGGLAADAVAFMVLCGRLSADVLPCKAAIGSAKNSAHGQQSRRKHAAGRQEQR